MKTEDAVKAIEQIRMIKAFCKFNQPLENALELAIISLSKEVKSDG